MSSLPKNVGTEWAGDVRGVWEPGGLPMDRRIAEDVPIPLALSVDHVSAVLSVDGPYPDQAS